jgi:hypothetical protein
VDEELDTERIERRWRPEERKWERGDNIRREGSGKNRKRHTLSVSYPSLRFRGGVGYRGNGEETETKRKEEGKGRQRPEGKEVGKMRQRPREKEVRKGRQRPGGKEVGKTESVRQLSVSCPCLRCGRKVGHRENREEMETRRKEVGKTESVRQLSVSYPCLKWVGGEGLIVVKTIVNT